MRQTGLEPVTYCLEGSCSIQLSYWRILPGWCEYYIPLSLKTGTIDPHEIQITNSLPAHW